MKLFIFGIDGLTMKVMSPLMEKGLLPNFKSIYDSRNTGVLNSTIPPITPPGWASIYSGKNPGKHGIFDFRRREGMLFRTNTCWDYDEAPPFWKHLSDAGKNSVLLNVPMYYPPLRIKNCTSVSGFNAIEGMDIYHPSPLKGEIEKIASDYKIDSEFSDGLIEGQEELLIKENLEITRDRVRVMNYLMKDKPWDLFFTVFTGTDRLQHFFWDKLLNCDPSLTEYYKVLDDALGDVLAYLKKEDVLFIVSDHGFGPVDKEINLNSVLQHNGLMTIKTVRELPIDYRKFQKIIDGFNVTSFLKRFVPDKLKLKFQEHTKIEDGFSFSKLDLENTKAFASSMYGGININLAGRESFGSVSLSESADIKNAVIEAFLSLTDAETGARVIEKAYKKEDIYSGKNLHLMPDIILLPASGYNFNDSLNNEGLISSRCSKECMGRVGDHEMESLFMFKCDDYNKALDHLSVIDIAPSVLNMFGLPIPTSMDGKSVFGDYREPLYLDELTGSVFKQGGQSKLNVRAKLKRLGL